MKSLTLLFCCFFCIVSDAQVVKRKPALEFDGTVRFKFTRYAFSGNNFLADANKTTFGVGVEAGIVKYRNYSLSFGYDRLSLETTNAAKAGNISTTVLNTIGGNILYEFSITYQCLLQPYVGLGSPVLTFRNIGQRFGRQTGIDFRVGCNLNYKVSSSVFFYLGSEFVLSKYDINIVPEFVNYYQDSKSVRLSIGIGLW